MHNLADNGLNVQQLYTSTSPKWHQNLADKVGIHMTQGRGYI